jgi:fibronectin-binding autotransporter adhesin
MRFSSRIFGVYVAGLFMGFVPCVFAATVTYTLQDSNFPTQFNSGGDFFNQGSTELGMWANSGAKQTAAWKNFTVDGNNGTTARNLQIGDVFTITVAATRAFGQIGFSLNAGGTQGSSYANNLSGSRMYVSTDNNAAWSVKGLSGGSTSSSLSYTPIQSTYKDYRFTVRITSQTTADVYLTVDGTDYRAYNLTMAGSAGANISAFSIFGSDMWDGDSNDNAFWKQTTTVQDTSRVELGYFQGSGGTFTPGLITDGLTANSASTSVANAVFVGGDGAVVLNQANTYTGATTVNANATARAQNAQAFGTTAGGVTVTSGGVIEISGTTAIGAESLTLNGTGISSGGALRNTANNNSWAGAVTLNADTRINSDAGTLTLSGTLGGGTRILYVGGSGNTTISGAITATKTDGNGAIYKDGTGTLTLSSANTGLSGLVRVLGGTVSIGAANNIGSGTVEITDSGTLATTATLTRTAGLLVGNGTTITPVISVATGTTFTQNGALTGAATSTTRLGKAGAGDLIFNAASGSTFNGQVQIGDGRVIIGVTGAMGANNSTTDRGIDLGLSVANTSQANNVSVLASNNVTVSQSVYVAANTSSATRTVGLSGTGSATFSNQFYLDGNVTVDAGSVATDQVTISGAILNTGGIIKAGSGILLLSGANTFTGSTTINAGTVRIDGDSKLGTAPGSATAGHLTMAGGTLETTANVTLSSNRGVSLGTGGGTFNIGSGTTTTYGGLIAGANSLTKSGAGTLTLSGNSTGFTGKTTISGGAISVSAAGNLGANPGATTTDQLTLSSGGKLTVSTGFTGNANAGITIGSGGGTIEVGSNQTFTQGGGLNGSGALSKTGDGILTLGTTAGNYSGTMTISAGIVRANTSLTSATVTVASGGKLGGSGSLGAVTVQSGGRLTPGNSPGNLTVSSLTLGAGSGYDWEIDNVTGTAGTHWDLITVTTSGGSAGGGTVTISSTSVSPHTIYISGTGTGFSNAGTYSWRIIDAGTLSGFSSDKFAVSYSTLNGVSSPTGNWTFTDSSGDLLLNYTAAAGSYDITVASGSSNQAETYTGNNALNKLGAGTLVLNNSSNSYTGATTIKAGTLQITVAAPNDANGALGKAVSAVVVGDSGAAVAATFDIGAAVQNSRAVTMQAGTGAADRTLSTSIGSGTATQSGAVAINSASIFSAASGGKLLVSGALTGTSGLTISGAGVVEITAANTGFSGGTALSSGATLRVGHDSALGTGGLTLNGGTLASDGGTARALANNVTMGGNVTLGDGTGTGALTFSGTVALGGNRVFTVGNTTTMSGIISGVSNGLEKAGSGTLILSANNTFSGTTTLTSGTLRATSSAGALGAGSLALAGGTLELANDTALSFSRNTTVSGNTTIRSDRLTAGAGVTHTLGTLSIGAQTLTVERGSIATSGTGTVTFGAVTLTGAATFSPAANAALNLGAISGTHNLTFTGSGDTTVTGAITTSTGTLTKSGAGVLVLQGDNTYTGTTTVNAGTLRIGAANRISDSSALSVSSGATFDMNGNNETVASIAGAGSISLGAGQLIAGDGNNQTFSGVISGTGTFVKKGSGTLTLSGANSYTGQSYLVAGTTRYDVAQAAGYTGTLNLGETSGTDSATLAIGAGGVTLGNEINVRSGSSGTMTIAALNSTGTATLSGNTTLNKNTTLAATNGGSLSLTGSTMSFANLTTLTVTNSANISIANQMTTSGDALVEKRGSGNLTLTSPGNSGDLRFDLYAGKLQVSAAGNLGSAGSYKGNKLYFDGGTLQATDNFTLAANNGITIGAGGGTIEVDSGKTLTVQEYINDGSATGISFFKTGAGTLFFDKSGSMDFSGTTLKIVDGTISTWNPVGNLSSTVELGSTSGTATTGTYRFQKTDGAVTTGANFVVNSGGGKIDVGANALTVSGNLTGSGAFAKVGAGTLELTGSGNTHSGVTTVEAGTLKLNRASGGAALSGSSIAVNNGGTLLLGASNQIGNDTALNLAGGTFSLAGNTDTVGRLTVSANSIFDFGTAGGSATSFTFSDFGTYSGSVLTINNAVAGSSIIFNTNYSGNTNFDFGNPNSFVSKVQFGTTGQFGQISFGTGTTTLLVAIPDARVYSAAVALIFLIGIAEVRRRRQRASRAV